MSEIDDLREQRADTNRKAAALAAENLRLNRKIKRLQRDLLRFGDHEVDCSIGQESLGICDCGFSEAMNEAHMISLQGKA